MVNNTSPTLKNLFQAHSYQISFTYLLTLLENLFQLLYPWAIGIAINGLLLNKYLTLTPLFVIWFAHIITGMLRQFYDTRVFTNIYSNLATSVILEQDKRGATTSKIVALSDFSRELVDFYEQDVPHIITTLLGFFGALIMLLFYDLLIGIYCAGLLIPLLIVNIFYSRQSRHLNSQLNDCLEQEVDILSSRQNAKIRNHYSLLRKWRIRLSDAEATNWGTIELLVMGIAIVVLLRTIKLPEINVGEIYAIISYFFNYLESLDEVPFLVQQFSRLQDISDRMIAN